MDAGHTTIRLWDLPVRIVHWAFVLLLPALWWTGEQGNLGLHRKLGYAMLALVLFRIVWGFLGSRTARFGSFVRGPAALFQYVRGLSGRNGEPIVGHNPIGALSVVALLSLLAGQVIAGLFAQDVDGIESGPLAHLVSYESADAAREVHHLLFNLILAFAVLHVAAVVFYLIVKRDNLVGPMVTGKRSFGDGVTQPAVAPLGRALVVAFVAALVAWWISMGAPIG